MRQLTKEELHFTFNASEDYLRCPICGEGYLYGGASGGMSLNCYCGQCEAEINLMGPSEAINLGGQLIKDPKNPVEKPDLRPKAFQCPYGIGYLLNWPGFSLLQYIHPWFEERASAGRWVYGDWYL